MLQMKTSSTHSASSISLMLHVLVQFANAPQNNSNDSWCHCLRFKKLLYLSKKLFGGLLKTTSKNFQKLLKVMAETFTRRFFCANIFFLCCRLLRIKAALLNPLIFFVTSLILFSSAASFIFIAFVLLVSRLTLSI